MTKSPLLTPLLVSLRGFLLFSVLFGLAYPGLVTLGTQALFSQQAEGSLIVKNGDKDTVLGSAWIGQNFTAPRYFWGRLSATTPAYNAANSSGSNFSPANPALLDAVKARLDALKKADPTNPAPVPVDLVTASASGLDPHITPAAALYQAARIAKERNLSLEAVKTLIQHHTQPRQFGILGEATVNVLQLNLALDGKLPPTAR